ncbi:MAG: ATP-dependent RNA helicase HrpA [Thermodesulfobacteriota bacterium]|nr:ATP-dependent RNA helicase HrpA [Thermodesulfobacteriota bacterium]
MARLEKRLQTSIKKKSWRKTNRPKLIYNDALPIFSKKDEIIDSISKNRVVIISGETGSGKTTQIPKFCLAAGRGINGKIGCTQPRRIAATTVSRRIAQELGEKLGRSVGYKIRFKNKTSPHAFIKIMTDGILLAETQNDPHLNEYDTIIVDEAHERSLNIDFILGILKTLIKKRKDLKIVITSATIDTKKFSTAFDNAPVIEVSGRMYPVEIRYSAIDSKLEENNEQTHIEMAVNAIDNLQIKSRSGDILVFMPTEQDIRETCELIKARNYKNTVIFPLFARLAGSEQSKVFSHIPSRKIIIATNIAETSITIPGIKYVIDTGLARISRYTPRSRTTSLPVTAISKSSANQRKGRCGRVENGVCIRLFSEQEFEKRPVFTPPEILRANLAEVILRMISLKLGDISDFPFIDRPASKSIQDGFDLLYELGAIVPEPRQKKSKAKTPFSITEKGKLMAKMPVDPRISRMLIEAQTQGCLEEITVIAAALSISDPRERPAEKAQEANQIHKAFNDMSSDFITLINIWRKYHRIRQKEKTTKSIKKFCKTHFLSFKRMREWRDIHAQLSEVLREYGLDDNKHRAKDVRIKQSTPAQPSKAKHPDQHSEFGSLYTSIHKSILSGFLSNIAVKKEKNIFQATKGKEVMIFPGSTLFNTSKTWVVAAEMVETSRLFARTCANINSDWLEKLGENLCKYTYLHPHWGRNRGEVVASEQVSLFGLIIVPQRPVSYGRIDPDQASDIFIQSALVNGDIEKKFDFMLHNQKLIDEVGGMEDKVRKRDILVSDAELFEFYHKRLKGCYDIRILSKHIKQKESDLFLRMKLEDILRYHPDEKKLSLYPDSINLGDHGFDCVYKFDPGKNQDGATVKIPLSYAPMVPSGSLDWLVPGLYREKITALIKGLPKVFRKKLVPIANTVDGIIDEMPKTQRSLITELGNFIYNRFGLDIPASAWPWDLLPDHLKMRISITDHKGKELCAGRDPSILRRNISGKTDPKESSKIESARKKWERTGITGWDFPDLPESISIIAGNKSKWVVYPGLQKASQQKKSVNLRLFLHPDQALDSHKEGVTRLFAIYFSKDLKFLKKALTLPKKNEKMANYFGGAKRLEKKLFESIINTLFCKNIRSKDAFYSYAESVAPAILPRGRELLDRSMSVLEAYHETRTVLYNLEIAHRTNRTALQFLKDLREELKKLVPETFMDLYDTERLIHLIRYIKTIDFRARRALVYFEKDRAKSKEVRFFTERLNKLLQELSPAASTEKKAAVEEYFWLIEEYKVSIFAQELKTPVRISKKRLEKKLKEIERMV